MMEKSNLPIKTKTEAIAIHGRVQVKENQRPVPDLLIQVFWVNPLEIKGVNQNWYAQIHREDAVHFAGEDITNASGIFKLSLQVDQALGDRPLIGLAAFPAEFEAPEKSEPIYISRVRKAMGRQKIFLLAIPKERLTAAGLLPPDLPTVKEILTRGEEQGKEITDWLRADQANRDGEIRKIVNRSRRAFRKFRPSSVPGSVRKQDNYLEDRTKLKETLAQVRGKTLKRFEEEDNIQTRKVMLSKEQAAELGLGDTAKKVQLPLKTVAKILNSEAYSGEGALRSQLLAERLRKEWEDRMADSLYEYFTEINEGEVKSGSEVA